MHVAAAIADPVPSRLVGQLDADERTAADLATEIARGRDAHRPDHPLDSRRSSMTTPASQIHEVLRTVDATASDPVIAVAQTFATTPDDLWEACTDPARLARWFEPLAGDLELGGRYELASSGTEGTIERCERPMLLAITWEHGGDVSRVVVTIARVEGGARLTIAHASARDDHWEAYGPAAGGMGWDESLLALALHLADDERSTPDAMAALFESEEGRTFAEASAAAWRQAYVDAGADPDEAEAAAARAIAAVFDED